MNVSVLVDLDVLNEKFDVGVQHVSEYNWSNPQEDWEEKESNYRLNNCSDVFYAVVDNKVVGHIGINDDQVKCIFVDEEFRGHGISYKLYEHVFDIFGTISSDDAREPAAEYMWKKMKKMYPSQIKYNSKKDIYIFYR